MEEPKHLKSKEHSQIDRLMFFSDGVFAIAITILIIELKVPALEHLNDELLWKSLSEMTLKFIGFLISFAIVGHYLVVHHKIFGYVQKSSNQLQWVNLTFLLSVVILPFSSAILGEFGSEVSMKIPYTIYTLNICFTAFMNGFLWYVVTNPKKPLLTHEISKARIKLGMYRTLVVPLVFIISLVISYPFPLTSRFIPLSIPVILHFAMKPLEKIANKADGMSLDD